jgi:hypothetical protein
MLPSILVSHYDTMLYTPFEIETNVLVMLHFSSFTNQRNIINGSTYVIMNVGYVYSVIVSL